MEIELLEEPATAISEYNPVAAGLAELRRKYGNVVVDVSTTKALDEIANYPELDALEMKRIARVAIKAAKGEA